MTSECVRRDDGTLLGVRSIEEMLEKGGAVIHTDVVESRWSREAREGFEVEVNCSTVVTGTDAVGPEWIFNICAGTLNTFEVIQTNESLETTRCQSNF